VKHVSVPSVTKEANETVHILHKACPLQDVSEGKIKGRIEVTGRRESVCKQLLDYLKNRGYSKLKEEALACNLWNGLEEAMDRS
jgi:hypothetical protein